MLNPVLSNYRIEIGDSFFPDFLTEKYDNFLYSINFPLKNLKSYIHETIQTISIPGLDLSTIQIDGLANGNNNPPNSPDFFHPTHSEIYEGTESYRNVISEKTITVTFKNTILNWMYLFEFCYKHYERVRETKVGSIYIIMYNSAEIPVLMFELKRCFITSMPGLEFSFNSSFSESKTFDISFTFNQLDTRFILPDFKQTIFTI